jgi:hypothetical protein
MANPQRGTVLALAIMMALAIIATLPAFAQTWVEFSVSSKGLGTRSMVINSSGQVAGFYTGNNSGDGESYAFVRNTDGTIVKLAAPKHTYLTPTAINAGGEIAGNIQYYNQFSGFYDFPPAAYQQFKISVSTSVAGLNDAGYIAGDDWCAAGCPTDGYLLSPTGTVTRIRIPESNHISVTGMNNSNQIVGSYVGRKKATYGFTYNAGNVTLLKVRGAAGVYAAGINDNGEVAGTWWNSSYADHGFVWTQANGFTSFNYPHGSTSGWGVTGINSTGAVVGSFNDANGHQHGFVRDVTGKFTILSAPHASNTWAMGINGSGQVTGFYYIGTSQVAHAFIYTP